MLTIRLIKTGKRNDSSFRVVLTEKTNAPQSGKFLEILGNYNPHNKEINLKEDRIKYWLSQGAKVSDTVHNLLVKKQVIKGDKIKIKLKKKKKTDSVSKEAPENKESEAKEKTEESKEEAEAKKVKENKEKVVKEKKEEIKDEEKIEENKLKKEEDKAH